MHIADLEEIRHTKTQLSSLPYLTQTIGKENIKDVHHLSRSIIDTARRPSFKESGDPESYGPNSSLLIYALNTCYDFHLPFALSPEVIWYTIISEIATCVKKDPETYAHLYTTTPKEKQKIPMKFVTGIMGIEIDDNGYYTPKLGFGVIETPPKEK